ncbi:MAG TPA: DUF6273 domain-containing protein [Clostridia bacterium]|nr:DUF6273 domain-containing protein [Clostridia bacterium]
MKSEDLRSQIIPTKISNTDENGKTGNEKFDTEDLIYLDSYDEQFGGELTNEERRVSPTDYAKMNNAYTSEDYTTHNGKETTWFWLRSSNNKHNIYFVKSNGDISKAYPGLHSNAGLCPSLHYNFPSNLNSFIGNKNLLLDIREEKNEKGEVIYHTLQIGEYPKTKVKEKLNRTLELLYNGGKIKDQILATGRWYSVNGQKESYKDYAGKHSPEYEYKGKRYARVISNTNRKDTQYSDGTISGEDGTVYWCKVKPISFKIKNWNDMPKAINPKGTGKARYFDLKADEVITANFPFYIEFDDDNSTMWQNSMIRGFFNGIDVRNITENGNQEFGADKGGNFTGECNFLNEGFNLSREPIHEYEIPDSETEIPDDAFNGCISLKKLTIHSKVTYVGKRAFEGLEFKYAYRQKTGKLIFSQELPENQENIEKIVELEKISRPFIGFDYNILVQNSNLKEIYNLSEKLNKSKFRIPYVYGLAIIDNGKINSFCENRDFRFFKNEIPNINDLLFDFPEEEKLDFFKFAENLGCFSTEKMLDKHGRETEVILAQKAVAVLTQLLKTDEMKLRSISWVI